MKATRSRNWLKCVHYVLDGSILVASISKHFSSQSHLPCILFCRQSQCAIPICMTRCMNLRECKRENAEAARSKSRREGGGMWRPKRRLTRRRDGIGFAAALRHSFLKTRNPHAQHTRAQSGGQSHHLVLFAAARETHAHARRERERERKQEPRRCRVFLRCVCVYSNIPLSVQPTGCGSV